jgi:hypothetical protein
MRMTKYKRGLELEHVNCKVHNISDFQIQKVLFHDFCWSFLESETLTEKIEELFGKKKIDQSMFIKKNPTLISILQNLQKLHLNFQ